MEEIQGLYAWGHDRDVGTFSKFSPFPAQPEWPHMCSPTSVYRLRPPPLSPLPSQMVPAPLASCCWASELPLPFSRQSGRQPLPPLTTWLSLPEPSLTSGCPEVGWGSCEPGCGTVLQ